MKKSTKKTLIKLLLSTIFLLILGVFICKRFDLLSTASTTSKLRNINNNEIVFNAGFFHDYVNIMLESTKNKNITDGLNFDIMDPDGKIVESGVLYVDTLFRQSYKSKSGQWKVVLHFKDNDANSIVNFGYSINSTKKNTMRVE